MDRIIVLDGAEYLICRELEIEGIHYIYAISVADNKYTVLTEYKRNGEAFVESVKDKAVIDKVLSIIAEENI